MTHKTMIITKHSHRPSKRLLNGRIERKTKHKTFKKNYVASYFHSLDLPWVWLGGNVEESWIMCLFSLGILES